MPLKALERGAAVRRVLRGLLVANIAVVGDAAHSSVDAVYNVLGLIVIRVAARAPDEEHPYGHRKFETLAALGICVVLAVTSFELLHGAVARLIAGGHLVQMSDRALVLLLGTLATNVFVAWYENRRGQQ